MVKYRVDLYKDNKLVRSVSISSHRKLTDKELEKTVKQLYGYLEYDRLEFAYVA